MPSFQFSITLEDSEPKIWREIIVPGYYTMFQFHIAIQAAFGWENCHLFQFSKKGYTDNLFYRIPHEDDFDDVDIIDAKTASIQDVLSNIGTSFVYIYDFSDEWFHKIKLKKELSDNIDFPICIKGGGACPPEDCGGVYGYAEVVTILNDPNNSENIGYSEWLGLSKGEKWDVSLFNIEEANKRLCLLR